MKSILTNVVRDAGKRRNRVRIRTVSFERTATIGRKKTNRAFIALARMDKSIVFERIALK